MTSTTTAAPAPLSRIEAAVCWETLWASSR